MEGGEHFILLPGRRLMEGRLLMLVLFPGRHHLAGPGLLRFIQVFQWGERNTHRILPHPRTGHHGEVAGGDVIGRLPRLLHPDAYLQGGAPHVVDAGMENDIPVYIGSMADEDVVDGRRHHPRIGMETAHVVQGGLLGNQVQDLQEEAEAEVPRNRFVHHHVAAPQLRIAPQGQGFVERGIIGTGHGTAPLAYFFHLIIAAIRPKERCYCD
jgi:hypothetical protein